MNISPRFAHIFLGSNVTFNCSSQGGPNNQYQWTHLESGQILSNAPELIITSVATDDEGYYECNVTNEAGSESAQASLNSE